MSMFIGEALFGEGNEIAHIDLLIGSKDGPVGAALVTGNTVVLKGASETPWAGRLDSKRVGTFR